jgi:hypothetical protein
MLIKRGRAEIIDVKKDDEHDIDDEMTRKAMEKAAEEAKTEAILKQSSDRQRGLEN